MSTNMAESVFTDVKVFTDMGEHTLNMPALTPSKPCCESHSHEHSDVKVPTIFDAVKSGFVKFLVQAGTGDVHHPHTSVPRLPDRFCTPLQLQ